MSNSRFLRGAGRLAALALLLLPVAGSAAPDQGQSLVMLTPRIAPQPAPQPQPGWGALYAAGAAHGLAVGRADRAEALGAAAALCARRSLDCRLVAEFTGRCGAVAQVVDREVLVALRPLGPASIMATAAGAGPTREQAQRAALENCARQGSGICVLVAGACNER